MQISSSTAQVVSGKFQAQASKESVSLVPSAVLRDPKDFWLPTSPWAGRMILPSQSERRDGGVYFEVLQAPRSHSNLKHKKVWLDLKKSDWTERVTRDVEFSERSTKSRAEGNILPDRINGWKSVSPLESIAGAHQKDDIKVALKNVVLTENGLQVEAEPVQISGSQKALVTFEKKIGEHTWSVRHWNPESKDFSGPEEIVTLPGRDDLAPMKDRRLNGKGWYLFGDADAKGQMSVAALEPRELFQLTTHQAVSGKEASLDYLNRENWRVEQLRQGQMTKTLLRPEMESKAPLTPLTQQMQETFKLGDKALLLHLFGGTVGGYTLLGLYTGHFSFGMAEVVKDDFTGEERFEVEYRQVYAHNPDGIVSGSQKWHAYMGDTHRGHLFERPVSDALVKVPAFFDDGQGRDLSQALEQRLSEMNARYRTGDGDGLSQVTAAQSCSQDSTQALYAAVSDWKTAIAQGEAAPELLDFCHKLTSHMTPFFGWAPKAWTKMADKQPADSKTLRWLPALKAPNTILPRANADGLTEMALKSEFPVMIFKTDVIGTEKLAVPAEPVRDLNPF